MKIFEIALPLIALLSIGFTTPQSQQPENGPTQQVFAKAERRGPDRSSLFLVQVKGGNYTIRYDGFVEAPGQYWHHHLQLPFGRPGHLERIYFLEQDDDLFFLYEVSNETSGWGYCERLNQKTLKTKWIAPVAGFNLGPALVEGNDVYLSAVNLLARLDLNSGKYVWQQTALDKDHPPAFEQFGLPSLTGNLAIFNEDASRGRVIEVDKATGKILKVRE